jgi:hypothetical protein
MIERPPGKRRAHGLMLTAHKPLSPSRPPLPGHPGTPSQGVPPVLRGWVWWHTSGAAAHRERGGATHFQRMVEAGERRPCLRQIELVGDSILL